MTLFILLAALLLPSNDSTGFTISGGVESNSALYVADGATHSPSVPQAGSNNYLTLTLNSKHFDAGIQGEWYPEPLRGYESGLKGFAAPMIYTRWRGNNFDLTAGSFHEQFGSGLLLRSWEDRQLGINNSFTGIRAAWTTELIRVSAFTALPRFLLRPSSTAVTGANAVLDISGLLNWSSQMTVEGSVIDRMCGKGGDALERLASLNGFEIPRNVAGYSLRTSFTEGGFYINFENVGKAADFHTDKRYKQEDGYSLRPGSAQLLETAWSGRDITASLSLRRLSNMEERIFRDDKAATVGNTLNYIPALCQRQTYMLAGLNPYVPLADGEIGGQGELFYHFRKGTFAGGRYGMRMRVCGSMFYATPEALSNWTIPRLAYRDINVELEKRFSKRFNATLFVSIQESSPTHGDRFATTAQNVFVAEGLYRFKSTLSLRCELQYLYSREGERDWMAALAELGLAPHWSLYASDMYNHGSTGIHYYDFGASYTLDAMRIAAGYGRHREGMICSGGVCRYQPAFTGGTLQLTYSF